MLLLRKLLEYQFPCYQGKVCPRILYVGKEWMLDHLQVPINFLNLAKFKEIVNGYFPLLLLEKFLACPDHSETFTHEKHSISLNVPPHMNYISQTHCHPKTKIGTQGEKDLNNSLKKVEKIPNIYISVIKGQRSVPMTFDLQFN